MIVLIATGIWTGAALFTFAMCRAAGRPNPANPSATAGSPAGVKQPGTDMPGLTTPNARNGA